jgi:Pyruvate/2-oxoacid:ferredoxin oxidoreductase delta subunit
MIENSYRKLAEHLDQLPGGFAPSDTNADLRILARLFRPEEAELAIHLTLKREEAQVIAERAGLPIAETERRLDEMSRKGLIFSVHPEEGPKLYQAVPFVVGIYEFQINNLSDGLLQDLDEYWSTMKPKPRPKTIPQMRTIPISESLEPHLEALPYEQVNKLVKAHDRFAVAPCICRSKETMKGGGCDAPLESCLMFDEWADYYVRDGRGRAIDRTEVMEILVRADAANLVLQPTNSKDVAAICCCCGCCCGILKGLQHHPKPAEAVASSYISQLEDELCDACWDCLERCQMQALYEGDNRVSLNSDRCIGCGLCVTTCPSGALRLVRKPSDDLVPLPDSIDATWEIISKAQAEMGV